MMKYQGYSAKVEYDSDEDLFNGHVLTLRDVITFKGRSVDELKKEFRTSVDFYLEMCEKRGLEPDRPFSGKFVVRVEDELHRAVAQSADHAGMSLNSWVSDCLVNAVECPTQLPFFLGPTAWASASAIKIDSTVGWSAEASGFTDAAAFSEAPEKLLVDGQEGLDFCAALEERNKTAVAGG